MIHTRSNQGHHYTVTAYAIQGRQLHRISLAGVYESVRAAHYALQHGHSGSFKGNQTTLGSPYVQVIRRRLSSEAFDARGFPKTLGRSSQTS